MSEWVGGCMRIQVNLQIVNEQLLLPMDPHTIVKAILSCVVLFNANINEEKIE